MAKPAARIFLLDGPGTVDRPAAVIAAREWLAIINSSLEEIADRSPEVDLRAKPHVHMINLNGRGDCAASADIDSGSPVELVPSERRPGQLGFVVKTPAFTIAWGTGGSSSQAESLERVVMVDASWTHVSQFPDRDEVRQAFDDALSLAGSRIWYLTNLPWDAALFRETAEELGQSDRCHSVLTPIRLNERTVIAEDPIPELADTDVVLLGYVPGRDERGAFQRQLSGFAQRAKLVMAYPLIPISTGPGLSRAEILEVVGMWLPARVLIAAGPLSEQVLLRRYLEENAGVSVTVGQLGGEYRVPTLELMRLSDGRRRQAARQPQAYARNGLLVAAKRRGQTLTLRGAGLPQEMQEILPRLRVSFRGKSDTQIVREIESLFGGRGYPPPVVRLID